ncbi:GFA family protein [Sphingomonas sp. LM7]|uniref:GFA family protein n=1 Tax=Sphingomonas sp. LM7 TaxID=1938607 RepID=UPI000983D81D|nr:GFA family protein [Sphingomonas sp. LM7]AQR72679.1 aldehyde-activating protein [Sphingomonas sp. LM7]
MTTHAGSCHCGGIRFTISHDPDELTTCDCSLCIKRNALMVKVPEAALRIDAGEELLALYEWNTRRARHHFCRRCGIYVFHRKRSAPDHFGVNVFCLDGFDRAALPVRATEGMGMTLECDAPRPEWPGPRDAAE